MTAADTFFLTQRTLDRVVSNPDEAVVSYIQKGIEGLVQACLTFADLVFRGSNQATPYLLKCMESQSKWPATSFTWTELQATVSIAKLILSDYPKMAICFVLQFLTNQRGLAPHILKIADALSKSERVI